MNRTDVELYKKQRAVTLAKRAVRQAQYELDLYCLPQASAEIVENLRGVINKMEAEAGDLSDAAIAVFNMQGDGSQSGHDMMGQHTEIMADAGVLEAAIDHIVALTKTLNKVKEAEEGQ